MKTTKKLLSILLAIVLVVGVFAFPSPAMAGDKENYGMPASVTVGSGSNKITYTDINEGKQYDEDELPNAFYEKIADHSAKQWNIVSTYVLAEYLAKQTSTPGTDNYESLTLKALDSNGTYGTRENPTISQTQAVRWITDVKPETQNMSQIPSWLVEYVKGQEARTISSNKEHLEGFAGFTDDYNPFKNIDNDELCVVTLNYKRANGQTPDGFFGVLTVFRDFQLQYLETGDAFTTAAGDLTYDEVVEKTKLGASVGSIGYEINENTSSTPVIGTAVNYATSGNTTFTLKQETTSTVQYRNSTTNSREYSFEEAAETGVETESKLPLLDDSKISFKVGLKASQAFGNSRANEGMTGTSTVIGQETTRTLPPHTVSPSKITSTAANIKLKYDYPVSVKYKVDMYYFSAEYLRKGAMLIPIASFGTKADSNDAAQNLKNRLASAANEANYGDGIKWSAAWLDSQIATKDYSLASVMGYTSLDFREAANSIADTRPMSVWGGQLQINGVSETSEVLPEQALYPLKSIEAPTQDPIEIEENQQQRIDNIALEGLNGAHVPYYGFDRRNGEWRLVGSDGTPHDGSIAEIVTTGSYKLVKGKGSGLVFLKYFIDEDKYTSYEGGSDPATNSSLSQTAEIPIIVGKAHVAPSKVSGRILDLDTGDGLPAELTLTNSEGEDVTSSADSSGYYEFPNLPVGAYKLTASLSGYETVESNFNIATDTEKDITMSKTKYTISGKITSIADNTGLPANVTLKKDDKEIATVRADVDGNYLFGNILYGNGYTLTTSYDGYNTDITNAFDVKANVLSKNIALKTAVANASMLSYDLGAKTYNGKAQGVSVTPKNDTLGLGKITVYYTGINGTKYAKSQTKPKDAGNYNVTVDIAKGAKVVAINDLALGKFTIKKADLSKVKVSIPNKTWTNKQLRPNSFVYNGMTFKNAGNVKELSYGKNTGIGKGKIKITGIGNFTGTKVVYFKIMPKKSSISKVNAGKGEIKVTWKKASKAQKIKAYQVRYRVKGTTGWTIRNTGDIKGLYKGERYEVQVRCVKKVSGQIYRGKWSKSKFSKKVK